MLKIKFIIVILAALVIEVAFLSPTRIMGVKPDLLLIITCYAALLFGFGTGCLIAFIAGLASDCFSGGSMGSMMIASLISVFIIAFIRKHLYKEHLTTKFTVIWICSYVFAYVSVNFTNFMHEIGKVRMLNIEFSAFAFVNLAFCCILIPLLDFIFRKEVRYK
ncbi:MAG: rod shape-determining protein MreD [Candidatus Aureabacteria bacterium]|nr:rod shape-determining protein MreD [Candidatus Auribacterota bacterium]